mmetsp:Transcript_2420/g.4403  ORF Transcript_2420/g.4403 Transcript_2420/m.4403 type:complete len:92 (+) Transcript_2420:1623-1898(+)
MEQLVTGVRTDRVSVALVWTDGVDLDPVSFTGRWKAIPSSSVVTRMRGFVNIMAADGFLSCGSRLLYNDEADVQTVVTTKGFCYQVITKTK